MAAPDVVCLGEALFDMIAAEKGKPKEEVTQWTGYPGGAPCNVACGMAQLGVSVAFVTSLGKDKQGDELVELMESRGVDVSAVKRVEQPTRDVFVVRTLDGDRVFDSFGQDTTTYCDCFIDSTALPEKMISDAKFLVMGTLGLAYETTATAMRRAMQIAKDAGTLVMVDLNWRPVFFPDPSNAQETIVPFVKQADLVKITHEEVEWAFGIPAAEALQSPAQVLEGLPDSKALLVTAGPKGAMFCFRDPESGEIHCGFIPAFKVDVQDTTGAGDAFLCGFMAYLLDKKRTKSIEETLKSDQELEKAITFAAACGALTTLKPGAIAAQPKIEAVEALVATRG